MDLVQHKLFHDDLVSAMRLADEERASVIDRAAIYMRAGLPAKDAANALGMSRANLYRLLAERAKRWET